MKKVLIIWLGQLIPIFVSGMIAFAKIVLFATSLGHRISSSVGKLIVFVLTVAKLIRYSFVVIFCSNKVLVKIGG